MMDRVVIPVDVVGFRKSLHLKLATGMILPLLGAINLALLS